jgi:hypothetical protein
MLLSIVGDYKISTPDSVNVNSTKKVIIPIKLTDSVDVYDILKDNLTLILSYKDGNDTINKTVTAFELANGNITFNYDLNVTSSTLTINYLNENRTLTKNTTLKYVINAKIIPVNLEAEYASDKFTFKLVDIDTNETLANKKLSYTIITGNINTGGSTTTDTTGIASIDNSNLSIYKFENGTISVLGHIPVGKQLFSIKGDDSSISASEIRNNFTITKARINIVINPYTAVYGSNKKVVINVTNAKSGEPMSQIVLHLYMANTTAKDYYFQTDSNGISQINVSGLVSGTYSLTVNNNDTVNMYKKTVSGKITITQKQAVVKVTVPKTVYYNSGTTATVKVTVKSDGKVIPNAIILVQTYTGKKSQAYLYQANAKGVATINYAPLSVGKHKVVISLADSRYKASAVTKYVTVKKATGKFSASAVTTYYKADKTFTIKLTNTKNNKPIYNGNVTIKLFVSSNRYYNYNGLTGQDGTLQLSLKSLKPGTYKVEIERGETKNYTAKKINSKIVIKKSPAKITAKSVTAKKGASKNFEVTVKNTKLNKPISGVKVNIKVFSGKSSKTYSATTNSKGIAKLNVKSISVGTHKVTVTSANKYVSAKSASSTIKITKK